MRNRLPWIFSILFFVTLLFTRFYNLDHTARFTRDESRDLVHMRQIVVDKKLTLVGPISNDNNKVFGSLTYYMLLPFVIGAHFMPIGPAIGAAVWGTLTALILIAITYKVNRRFLIVILPLVLLWFPLLETSRWAWNPHFVLFWISLGILFTCWKKLWAYFSAGISLSLSFHNHYIAFFATSVFVGLLFLQTCLREKAYKRAFALGIGYVLPFLPFFLFDFLHPPGIFVTRYLLGGDTPQTAAFTLQSGMEKIAHAAAMSVHYLAPVPYLPIVIGVLLVLLAVLDIRARSKNLLWFLPVLAQLGMSVILVDYQTRYFLPALPFLFVWLIVPRKHLASKIAKVITVLLLIGSFLTAHDQLTKTSVPPDIYSLTKATAIIAGVVKDPNTPIKNPNIAVLSAPDTDPMAEKYRDALSIYDIHFLTSAQYNVSENLFVVSPAPEAQLRADGDYAMKPFKNSILRHTYTIPNSPWKVYWFSF